MERLRPVDVVIVGGGWTGLLMAKEIATRTALTVSVLERGAPPRNYVDTMDELDYSIRLRMMQNLSEETVTHRHSIRDRAAPVRQYGPFNPGTGVGGAGEHWGAVSNRYRPDQFLLATHLRQRYDRDRLAENLAVQDWGLTYDELEQYYSIAEKMLGVCGKAGNIRGTKVEGGDPFEGPRSDDFPNPVHKSAYFPSLFHKAALDLGYRPFPIPTATLSQAYRNPDGIERPACMYCGYCAKYGCMIGAKAQPSNTLLPILRNKSNFKLRTGCWVRRVIHHGGQAQGVTYVDASGREKMQPASVVILSSWTTSNVRLLLLSGIGEPYNPTTGEGTVGKNLTHQVSLDVPVYLDKPLNLFMGTGGLGFAIGEFVADPVGSDISSGVLRGSEIRANSNGTGPISSFGKIPSGEVQSDWGAEWKNAALKWNGKAGQIVAEAAHLPYRHNFFDLDSTYTDKFGDPLVRLTLDWTDHEHRLRASLAKPMIELGKAMGARVGPAAHQNEIHYSTVYYQSTHLQGGAIMGSSPQNSVVNPWLQHWDVSNLWVTGGSTFPQSEGAAPTLTILATAYRAADAFVNRYLKKAGALA
jgi:gluconate 2-dehydrogenase alpha chain